MTTWLADIGVPLVPWYGLRAFAVLVWELRYLFAWLWLAGWCYVLLCRRWPTAGYLLGWFVIGVVQGMLRGGRSRRW